MLLITSCILRFNRSMSTHSILYICNGIYSFYGGYSQSQGQNLQCEFGIKLWMRVFCDIMP